LQDKQIPDYVTIIRIHGPFLFGAAEKIGEVMDRVDELEAVVILRLRNTTAVDATGLLTLEDFADRLKANGRALIPCGARTQPAKMMHLARFERHFGKENICDSIQTALDRARAVFATQSDKRLEPTSMSMEGHAALVSVSR
jgi:SulP family sulfate permease